MSTGDWRWVSCSITEFGHIGERRHLARKGATYPDIWQRNARKPKCSTCKEGMAGGGEQ